MHVEIKTRKTTNVYENQLFEEPKYDRSLSTRILLFPFICIQVPYIIHENGEKYQLTATFKLPLPPTPPYLTLAPTLNDFRIFYFSKFFLNEMVYFRV